MLIESTKIYRIGLERLGFEPTLLQRRILATARSGETAGEICGRLEGEGFSSREVIDTLGGLVAKGIIDVGWAARSPELELVFKGGPEAESLYRCAPHWWNVVAYEREWDEYPEYNDFLSEASPVYHRKRFQWEIYETLLRAELKSLTRGARVLDVGGGVGRAAVPLASRGCDVTLVDASPRALNAAWGRLSGLRAAGYDLAWSDVSRLDFIPDGSMDAALALEVLCYVGTPEKALAEAVRCVRPGGWVAFSVENRLGALIADRHLDSADKIGIFMKGEAAIEGELYVRYFEEREIKAMAARAGLKSVRLAGCHYIADGIFGAAAEETHYADPGARKRLLRLEDTLRRLPIVNKISRAVLAVGKK